MKDIHLACFGHQQVVNIINMNLSHPKYNEKLTLTQEIFKGKISHTHTHTHTYAFVHCFNVFLFFCRPAKAYSQEEWYTTICHKWGKWGQDAWVVAQGDVVSTHTYTHTHTHTHTVYSGKIIVFSLFAGAIHGPRKGAMVWSQGGQMSLRLHCSVMSVPWLGLEGTFAGGP